MLCRMSFQILQTWIVDKPAKWLYARNKDNWYPCSAAQHIMLTLYIMSFVSSAVFRCISYAGSNVFLYLVGVWSGVQLSEFQTRSAVRTCGLSFSGNLVMYTTDKAMSQSCEMLVYDLRDEGQMSEFLYFSAVKNTHVMLSFVSCIAVLLCEITFSRL